MGSQSTLKIWGSATSKLSTRIWDAQDLDWKNDQIGQTGRVRGVSRNGSGSAHHDLSATTTVTAAHAAQRLGIDARMVHELLRQKVIQGRQIVPYASRQIPIEALDLPDVQKRLREIKNGDRTRRSIAVDTQTMGLPGIE